MTLKVKNQEPRNSLDDDDIKSSPAGDVGLTVYYKNKVTFKITKFTMYMGIKANEDSSQDGTEGSRRADENINNMSSANILH